MIKAFRNNKLLSNGIWMYSLQFFNLVVPLLTIPYVTRILGTELYGIFSISLNFITYLQVVVEYGFGMSATRKVAVENNNDLNKLFTAVQLGRCILLTFCIVVSIFYVIINLDNIILCTCNTILFISLLGYCLQVNWFFQGIQEMKYISIVNVLGRTISTVMIFMLVKSQNDLLLYSFLYSLSPLTSGVISLLIAKKKYNLRLVKIKLIDILLELKDGFLVFTTQLNSKVFGMIGITFLGIYATSSQVGIYTAIQKIPNILILVWTPIAQIIFPISSMRFNTEFSKGYELIKKMRKIVLPLFGVIGIIICFFSKDVINILFGSEYTIYYYWLYPLILWLLVAIDNNLLGVQILLGSKHDKEYWKVFNIGVTITIFLNYILIKQFGGGGASMAPLLSEIILNVMLHKEIAVILKKYR